MTEEQFMQSIEGAVNDAWDGATSKQEALKGIMKLFFTTLDPLLTVKDHLELFIYRVKKMRELQEKYFKGNKKVLGDSMKLEKLVDAAIDKMTTEMEYSIQKYLDKEKQQNLFA